MLTSNWKDEYRKWTKIVAIVSFSEALPQYSHTCIPQISCKSQYHVGGLDQIQALQTRAMVRVRNVHYWQGIQGHCSNLLSRAASHSVLLWGSAIARSIAKFSKEWLYSTVPYTGRLSVHSLRVMQGVLNQRPRAYSQASLLMPRRLYMKIYHDAQ